MDKHEIVFFPHYLPVLGEDFFLSYALQNSDAETL